MPTPAEQYRALVARLEALQESPISAITQALAPQQQTQGGGAPNAPVTGGAITTGRPATGGAVTPQTPLQRMASLPKDEQDKIMSVLYKNTQQLGPQAQRMLPATATPAQTASNPDQQPNMDPVTNPGTADKPAQVPPQ